MILPDVNILLYAYDTTSPFHPKASAWWSKCLDGSETVALCPVVVFGFVRIITNSRAFSHPFAIRDASAQVRKWLEQPAVQWVETELHDVEQALSLLVEAGTGGNLTTDAQIAAISLRLGATVYTVDRDYNRFPRVRWHNPLAPGRQR